MKRHYQVILALALIVLGCTARYIAEYDPAIDGGAVELQAKLGGLLDELQRTAGTPGGAFANYTSLYEELYADVDRLQAQAATQERNELTLTSLKLIHDNLDQLTLAHQEGLTLGQVPVMRRLFDTQLRMLVQLETAKKRDEAALAEVTQ